MEGEIDAMDNIITKEVLLTPELAREFLTENDPRQRALNQGHAGTLARDIVRGGWDDRMSEPIDFSAEGYMINGQHRCMAVIKAGVPIVAKVRYNCPPEWFEKYDRAKARTVTDYYKGKEAKVVATVATFAICIESGGTLWSAVKGRVGHAYSACVVPTVGERLDYINANEGELQHFASQGAKFYKVARFGSKGTFASALWYLHNNGVDVILLDDMVEDFKRPAPHNYNVATLKAWYMRQITDYIKNRMHPPRDFIFSLVLALYEGYINDKPIKQPRTALKKAWEKYAEREVIK